MRAAPPVSVWLVLVALPAVLPLAAALGLTEHRYIVAQIADMSAAAAASLQAGSNLPPGGLLAALALAAADIALVVVAFNALLTALAPYRHGEALFPWLNAALLGSAVVLCFGCAWTLGIGIGWMVALGLLLWLIGGID